MPAVIHWFRRDLRLSDNPALSAAAAMGIPVIPVYILEDNHTYSRPLGKASQWWLYHSLKALDTTLQTLGSQLILKRGHDITQILLTLAREVNADQVTLTHVIADDKREPSLIKALAQAGIKVHLFDGMTLVKPEMLKTQQGGFFRVFTPFWRACIAKYTLPRPILAPSCLLAPHRMPKGDNFENWGFLSSEIAENDRLAQYWQPGEVGGLARLEAFISDDMHLYASNRDRMDQQLTSRLSPYLSFGNVSPRQCYHAVSSHPNQSSGAIAFLRQVIWREFCQHLLHHRPDIDHQPLRAEWQYFPWHEDKTLIKRWKKGRTGFPSVDAGMRELWHTGWMHNRARLITASFLVKHLLQPWQAGEAWFWDRLVDADLANNTANWQWVAGCGADAAPYFRIFNPMLQGAKFDPKGTYIKQWLPELAQLDPPMIHAPWQAPSLFDQAIYPFPIVDHTQARKRALALYHTFRESIQKHNQHR